MFLSTETFLYLIFELNDGTYANRFTCAQPPDWTVAANSGYLAALGSSLRQRRRQEWPVGQGEDRIWGIPQGLSIQLARSCSGSGHVGHVPALSARTNPRNFAARVFVMHMCRGASAVRFSSARCAACAVGFVTMWLLALGVR
jgi:hypothetical protein